MEWVYLETYKLRFYHDYWRQLFSWLSDTEFNKKKIELRRAGYASNIRFPVTKTLIIQVPLTHFHLPAPKKATQENHSTLKSHVSKLKMFRSTCISEDCFTPTHIKHSKSDIVTLIIYAKFIYRHYISVITAFLQQLIEHLVKALKPINSNQYEDKCGFPSSILKRS